MFVEISLMANNALLSKKIKKPTGMVGLTLLKYLFFDDENGFSKSFSIVSAKIRVWLILDGMLRDAELW